MRPIPVLLSQLQKIIVSDLLGIDVNAELLEILKYLLIAECFLG
jgi:hypothetical protein